MEVEKWLQMFSHSSYNIIISLCNWKVQKLFESLQLLFMDRPVVEKLLNVLWVTLQYLSPVSTISAWNSWDHDSFLLRAHEKEEMFALLESRW